MKLVSILGDSISTFEGYNPPGYSVFYDEEMQYRNGLKTADDTWWARVNRALKATLCINNSYSGSRVTGAGFPSAYCDERLLCLHTEQYNPDIILVYLGVNDFGAGVKVKRGIFLKKDFFSFEYAYDVMVSKIKKLYPTATIICGTLMKSIIRNQKEWVFPECFAGVNLADYNDAIRWIGKRRKCLVADLASLALRYETLDGTHPTVEGHKEIAEAWVVCLKQIELLWLFGSMSG